MKANNFILQRYRGLCGKIVELGVNFRQQPIVFQDRNGFRFQLLPGDEISSYWKRRSVTDSINVVDFILENIKKDSVCIDIGSHIGGISIPLLYMSGLDGKVISVDADPHNVERIKTNLEINDYPKNVKHAALTDKKGVVQLICYVGINGWQTLGNPHFAEGYKSSLIEVPAISFSDLMEEFGLESVDFVKIDVEGAEPMVFCGMAEFLKQKRIGCVIFEVNHLTLEGFGKTVDDLMSFWNNYDYELWRLGSEGSLEPITDKWPENCIGDCVALPR